MFFELKTFLIAMTPVFGIRISIPVALAFYDLSIWSVYFFSMLGSMVSTIFVLSLLEKGSQFLSRIYFFNRFFTWLFAKFRKTHHRTFEKYKEFALIIFVGIPLPFSGSWTGSLCAFLFGIPFKKALPLIVLGNMIACAAIIAFTLAGISIEKYFGWHILSGLLVIAGLIWLVFKKYK